MDLQTCNLFARYNQVANNEMNLLIGKLDNLQWNKDFGGYFKSIKEVCNHIYLADFHWLKRFSGLRAFDYIKDPLFDLTLSFGTTPLNEINDYLKQRKELDEKLLQFTKELRPDDFDMALSYSDSKGVRYTRNFGGLIYHAFNHQTHHRGMVSVYLDIMNISNDFSNVSSLV
jgi:uncharacterized damage-inducible protein DinB